MTKRKRRSRRSSRDPLRVQVSVRVARKRDALGRFVKVSTKLLRAAVRYRINEGEDHAGFETRIVRWQNPGRKGAKRAWRQGNQEDAWTTLGQALADAPIEFVTTGPNDAIRPRQRRSKPARRPARLRSPKKSTRTKTRAKPQRDAKGSARGRTAPAKRKVQPQPPRMARQNRPTRKAAAGGNGRTASATRQRRKTRKP